MKAKHKELDQNENLDLDKPAKQFRAALSSRRLSGRPSIEHLRSFSKAQSLDGNPSLSSLISEASDSTVSRHHSHDNLLKQVSSWLKNEKARRTARKAK